MSDAEFWAATPREIAWLADEYVEVQKEHRVLVGVLAAAELSAAGAKPPDGDTCWQPWHFFPDTKPERRERTLREIERGFDNAFYAFKRSAGKMSPADYEYLNRQVAKCQDANRN